jgi:hypothetical protein
MVLVLTLLLVGLPAYASPVILVSATTEPANISPGDEFTLKLKMKNAGDSKASGTVMTLDIKSISSTEAPASTEQRSVSPKAPISVIGDSNVRYLGSIYKGGEVEASFLMIADGSAQSGTYNLDIKLDYSTRSQSQVVGIVLIRKPDLDIIQPAVPSKAEAGKKFNFATDIVNAGNYVANCVSVELGSDGADIESPNYFVGTLEASDIDTFETQVTFDKPGGKDLKLRVNYIDDFNRTHTIEKDFKIKIGDHADEVESRKESAGFLASMARFFKAIFGLGGSEG